MWLSSDLSSVEVCSAGALGNVGACRLSLLQQQGLDTCMLGLGSLRSTCNASWQASEWVQKAELAARSQNKDAEKTRASMKAGGEAHLAPHFDGRP